MVSRAQPPELTRALGVLGNRIMNWLSKRNQVEAQPARGIQALAQPDRSLSVLSPELNAVLGTSTVLIHLQSYARFDRDAISQQRRLMQELTVANVCLMIAGVLSGLVLAGGAMRDHLGPLWTDRLALVLGATTLIMGALAAMLTFWARESDRLRRWLSLRSRAEMARLSAFREIANALTVASPEAAMQGLTLIREHLLDDQRSYMHDRATRHRRSSEWTSVWGGLATALAFVGGSGAVIASFVPSQNWMPVAGVVGAALAAYAANREGLRRDRANSDRCEKAAAALDELAARFDAVEAQIRAGHSDVIIAFTNAVADQLAGEHRQWLEGTAQAELAVAKLEAQLQHLGASRHEQEEPLGNNSSA
jgi:hypothetical protein